MTFASTASTIIHTGATPVFADIDYAEPAASTRMRSRKRLRSRTKAIVPVHYSGQVCDLDRIYAIADKHGLTVCERRCGTCAVEPLQGPSDRQQTAGRGLLQFLCHEKPLHGRRRYAGRPTTTRSTHAHGSSTGQGMSHNAWNRYAKGGSWKYDIAEPGFKYNMFDIQAALGLVQLSRLEEMQAARLKIAAKYQEAFGKIDALDPPFVPDYTTHCWHLYVLRIVPELLTIDRDQFIVELQRAQRRHKRAFYPGTQHVGLSEAFRLCGQRLPDGAEAFRTDHLPPALSHDDGRAGGLCYRSCNGHCRNLSQINLSKLTEAMWRISTWLLFISWSLQSSVEKADEQPDSQSIQDGTPPRFDSHTARQRLCHRSPPGLPRPRPSLRWRAHG